MVSRFISIVLMAVIFGIVLAGCGATTEQTPAQQPISEAAAPMPTPVPPAPPTDTPVPAVVPEESTTVPAAANEEAIEPTAAVRTFRIVADQSEASYQVSEEFFNRPLGLVNAIGRTNAIEGEFQLNINGSQVQLTDNQFSVDLRTLASDEARRDQRIREEWLESNTYPLAEFTATTIENFPADATEGQDIPFKISGDMTIREITRPATFDVVARLDGNTFTGTATTNLLMQDYGFEPPSILGMLQVTDGVTVTVNFVAAETAEPSS